MADRVYPSTKPNSTATAAADRVHPSTKTNGTGTATASGAVGIPPIPKPPSVQAKLYNPTSHPYRPKPAASLRRRKNRHFSYRRCFCLTCFWSTLLLMVILLLASITAVVFYVLYHPQNSSFSVTSLKISSFNLTTSPADETTQLTTKFNLTLSPNKPPKPINSIPPIKNTGQKKQGFKLYERRNSLKNGLMINTLMSGFSQNAGFSPRKPEILSPSNLDFPALVLCPVAPLNDDTLSKSSTAASPSKQTPPKILEGHKYQYQHNQARK